MKTREEIEDLLNKTSLELDYATQWANEAEERYYRDKKDWGEADNGELLSSRSTVSILSQEINTLKWVLNL
jgi:hypothetical protein